MTTSAVRVHNQVALSHRDVYRCAVAAQANMTGYQSLRVECLTPNFTGRSSGVISIRVGQVLVYLEDREALQSWVAAIQRAIELQDRAYGPEMPPPALGPRRC